MRLLGVALCLAACGGSPAAPASRSPASTPPPAVDEDWRGVLSQLVGETCEWIPGASLLHCRLGDDRALLGWEPHNRRYAYWMIAPDGDVRVLPGTVSGDTWTFTDSGAVLTLRRTATGWSVEANAVGGGELFAATIVATGAQPAPAPVTPGAYRPDEDWRSPLEQLSATWSFAGTAKGEPAAWRETCRWTAGTTFVLCKETGATGFTLLGYELHNRRYVHYGFPKNGEPEVLAGTVTKGSWQLTDGKKRASLIRETPIQYAFRAESLADDGSWRVDVEGLYTTEIDN